MGLGERGGSLLEGRTRTQERIFPTRDSGASGEKNRIVAADGASDESSRALGYGVFCATAAAPRSATSACVVLSIDSVAAAAERGREPARARLRRAQAGTSAVICPCSALACEVEAAARGHLQLDRAVRGGDLAPAALIAPAGTRRTAARSASTSTGPRKPSSDDLVAGRANARALLEAVRAHGAVAHRPPSPARRCG